MEEVLGRWCLKEGMQVKRPRECQISGGGQNENKMEQIHERIVGEKFVLQITLKHCGNGKRVKSFTKRNYSHLSIYRSRHFLPVLAGGEM